MVTMANFVTGPFLDLFGATVYDHLNGEQPCPPPFMMHENKGTR